MDCNYGNLIPSENGNKMEVLPFSCSFLFLSTIQMATNRTPILFKIFQMSLAEVCQKCIWPFSAYSWEVKSAHSLANWSAIVHYNCCIYSYQKNCNCWICLSPCWVANRLNSRYWPFQRKTGLLSQDSQLHKFHQVKDWRVYSAGLQRKHIQRQQKQQHLESWGDCFPDSITWPKEAYVRFNKNKSIISFLMLTKNLTALKMPESKRYPDC